MDHVDVVALVGACAPERHRYAIRLARGSRRALIPASRLENESDPALTAASLIPWADQAAGAVVEFPSTVPATEIIGAVADPEGTARLIGIVCVVDAAHLLDDLSVDDFLVSERDALGEPTDYVARASLTVTQIEYASMIVLVGWETVPTPELSTVMALVNALSPRARLRLDQGGIDAIAPGCAFAPGQDRSGWMGVLNGEAAPHMTDPRVTAFRYEQLRPFHPERLSEVLMHRFESGEFGQIVRSAGLCRLASRPQSVLQWDHVGRTIAFHIVSEQHEPEGELAAVGQELAFIGLDLHRTALAAALDEAALTDEELTAGPDAWISYPDPFPASETADGRTP